MFKIEIAFNIITLNLLANLIIRIIRINIHNNLSHRWTTIPFRMKVYLLDTINYLLRMPIIIITKAIKRITISLVLIKNTII